MDGMSKRISRRTTFQADEKDQALDVLNLSQSWQGSNPHFARCAPEPNARSVNPGLCGFTIRITFSLLAPQDYGQIDNLNIAVSLFLQCHKFELVQQANS